MFNSKTLLTALAVATTLSLASCKDAAKEKAKVTADSLAKVVTADSLKKIEDDAKAKAEADKPKSLVDVASANAPTLAKLVVAAGLADMVGKETLTIFAPAEAVLAAEAEMLMKPENKAKLVALLQKHVTKGAVMAADLKDGQMVEMEDKSKHKVSIKDGKTMIGNATVTAADMKASNGVIHSIDVVIK